MDEGKTDLSPYELARLEKIKRNNDFLKNIGLGPKKILKAPKPPNHKRQRLAQPRVPTRSSKRIREAQAREDVKSSESILDDGKEELADISNKGIDYDSTPREPDELDDSEFQVYISLRSWRLRKSRELDIEAYKVFQNRTICEMVRRRRNDKMFAGREGMKGTSTVEKDLLLVWGIGPAKAEQGGFGWEALDVLDIPENKMLLMASREVCDNPPELSGIADKSDNQ
mmetsp:Transcript_15665/g.22496  ORF Transcript_15665/g.22496 Transcript_15665/m.22496 type:complete len:227 (+) Transcript_15665:3-683(+)